MELFDKLLEVSRLFRIDYEYVGYDVIKSGNVHHTYKVNFLLPDGTPKSFLVQNVNTYAFRNPVGLMENVDKITEYIRAKNPGQLALHFHHTADRKTYVLDGENFWRMTNYVPSVTYNSTTDENVLRNTGKAYGEFQNNLCDFDPSTIIETIPGFHNTRQRYENFIQSVKNDAAGRAASVREEIDYLLSVQDQACALTDLQMKGELPLRVTHNDTKINNVLFREDTGESLIVIDLDTVMPGVMGHDFGDAIRFAANFVEEDCEDYEKAGVNMEVFRAFAEGFLSMTANSMTQKEIDTLALSCFCITVELATRFLADYLDGDKYFKTRYDGHNLVRARCQIALAKDMLKKMDEMEAMVRECVAAARK